jgi:hypothetical protein
LFGRRLHSEETRSAHPHRPRAAVQPPTTLASSCRPAPRSGCCGAVVLPNVLGMSCGGAALRSVYLLAVSSIPLLGTPCQSVGRNAAGDQWWKHTCDPLPLAHPVRDPCPVLMWSQRCTRHVSVAVAECARRNDVVRLVAPAVDSCMQMLSRATKKSRLTLRESMARCEVKGIVHPHRQTAVVAAESLANGGPKAPALDSSCHADLHGSIR